MFLKARGERGEREQSLELRQPSSDQPSAQQRPSSDQPSASQGRGESGPLEAVTALECLRLWECQLEAARKQWHVPSLLLSNFSAGLCVAQALGTLQRNETGEAYGTC